MSATLDRKISATEAKPIAAEIVDALRPQCEKLVVAGSLRRRAPYVSDIEFIFIPKFTIQPDPGDLFGKRTLTNQTDLFLDELVKMQLIGKRLNKLELPAWGARNKLGIHLPSGVSVDFFTANLVCRTGGAITNTRIASAAIQRGWQWHPYGAGFSRRVGHGVHRVGSEQDVFEFVGLHYLEPWERA